MKIRPLVLVLALLCFSLSIIASGIPDSLRQHLWELSDDSSRIEHLTRNMEKLVYSDPDQSMEVALLADSIANKANDSLLIAQAYNLNGMALYSLGQYDRSLEYYLRAIPIFERLNAKLFIGQIYNNLAGTYQITGDLEGSIRYFEKALQSQKAQDDSIWMAHVTNNLAIQHMNAGHLQIADDYFQQVMSIYEVSDRPLYLGITNLNYGNLKVEKQEYKNAIKLFQRAMSLVPKEVNALLPAAALGGIGIAYFREGNLQAAESNLQKSIVLAEEIGHFEQQKVSSEELIKVYEKQGRLQDALDMFRWYEVAKDSFFINQQNQRLTDAMQKYEVAEKEKEIDLLNAKNEVTELRLVNSRKTMWGLALASLFFLGFLYYFWSLNKTIKNQNKTIKKTLGERETLLREIHHRVKNNLQFISSLLSLQSRHVEDLNAKSALKDGQDRVRSMALIHQNLYQDNSLTGIDVLEYFNRLVTNLCDSYHLTSGQIEFDLDLQPILLDVDTLIPLGLIVNELISNSLKHAFPQQGPGKIKLSLREEKESLIVEVSDSGVGMPDKKNNASGKTFGYKLINALKIQLDAEIMVEVQNGTKVRLVIENFQKVA